MNFALAAQMGDTLLDAEQPKALGMLDVESFSIVTDGKYETLWFLLDLDTHGRRIRVGGAIMQSLLHHAINACFVFVGEIVRDEVRTDGHIYARLPGYFTRLPLKS